MSNSKDLKSKLGLKRLLIPVLLGLGVATWLLINDLNKVHYELDMRHGTHTWADKDLDGEVDLDDPDEFLPATDGVGSYREVSYINVLRSVEWTWYSTLWLFMALLFTAFRDLAYMFRIRILTDYRLNWRNSFDVIMLWEFASALTPSVVGGSGVAIFILGKEGIPLGRSTATIFITGLLDELFYILTVPVIILIVGSERLFPRELDNAFYDLPIQTIFWLGYGFMVMLTLIIIFAIFFRPRTFKFILLQIFRIRFLRKWRYLIIKIGDDMITSSKEFKGKGFTFWLKSFGATFFSWTSRYWVVNFLILAFFPVSDHLLLYGKQLVMWVIMLISPTPGSSGVAEYAFSVFLGDFILIGSLVSAIVILWRLLTYYLYLFMGSIVLPRWIRKTRHI